MKIKQLRQVVAGLFPAQFAPVFARAYTAKEISLVADAIGVAARDANKREMDFVVANARTQATIDMLSSRLQVAEENLDRFLAQSKIPVATVRDPQEEVFLVPPQSGPATAGSPPADLRNKIGLIKAVREVSNLGLKEAKDLVEDVLDRGLNKSVFKGSLEKAAVADRIIKAAGGTTLRKEAF